MESLLSTPKEYEDTPTPSSRVGAVARTFGSRRHRFEREHDHRAACVLAFQMLYEQLARALDDDDNGFDDPNWVADLAETFAALAFVAFDGIDRACEACRDTPDFEGVPRAWAEVYRVTATPGCTVLEDLLCGLVAHIGHDLPVALAHVGLETNGTSRIRDFHRVNDVLASVTDSVQRAVMYRYDRWLGTLDRLGGGFDEVVTDLIIQVFRGVAWYNACRLLDEASAAEARAEVESVTERVVGPLRKPARLRTRVFIWWGRVILRGRRQWPADSSEELLTLLVQGERQEAKRTGSPSASPAISGTT